MSMNVFFVHILPPKNIASLICNLLKMNIMKLRFGIDGQEKEKTQKEVADMLGISQSYISRLEKKIIRKMKKEIMSKTG